MFPREGFRCVTTIENHQLITPWKAEAGSDIAEEGRRIPKSIIAKLPRFPICQHPLLYSICKMACSLVHLRRELELLCFFALVRMSTIVYDCEIFRTIILIAKVRESLVQSRLPTF